MDHAARVRVLRRLEWAADIVDYVESFIDLPHVEVPDFSWDSDSGSDEDIEHLALRVRQEWSLGNGPIHDMVPLLENHGFILIREPVGCDDMDAVCRWQTGRPFILYSSEVKSNPRTNFNLAHELGHILIHGGVEVDSENIAKIERQANRFAGAFLLPRNSFPLEVLSTSIEYFKTLKSRWRVAISAMIYRCKDLEILNSSQVGYLWRQMNALGIKKIEPLDSAFPISAPSLLSASLEMLVKNRVQTREEIEVAINLNPSDIESLGGTEAGWLSAEKVVNFRPKLILRQAE
jgi:Zn-dependent peptidase ImmA (M78 family)